jgi:hypothetical protein
MRQKSHISSRRKVSIWKDVKLTSKKIDATDPAENTTVKKIGSNIDTTKPTIPIPINGESKKRQAAFTKKSVFGFILFRINIWWSSMCSIVVKAKKKMVVLAYNLLHMMRQFYV